MNIFEQYNSRSGRAELIVPLELSEHNEFLDGHLDSSQSDLDQGICQNFRSLGRELDCSIV